MIEIFNENRTKSLGWFKNFKVAKGTLNELATSGKLGENPSVLVCSYKSNEPQSEYAATYSAYFGKWDVQVHSKVCSPVLKDKRKVCRKKSGAKKYKSSVDYFREGFPDWMNKVYQPV